MNWNIEQPHHDTAYVMDENDHVVATMGLFHPDSERNARLVEAAPRLEELLGDVIGHAPLGHHLYATDEEWIGKLREASHLLQRIRGEETA